MTFRFLGAGPLGPFVLQAVSGAGGGMTPMDIGSMGRGRGFDGHRSNSTGRFGGGTGWNDRREYYDLDAPQNNRAVLDYGDL